jgi:hypothetical protein
VTLAVATAPAPALAKKAPPSGLLLGQCEAGCRTLWITNEAGTWTVKAEGPGIVVPRRSGFWWVGINKPAEEKDWFRWLLWAAPVGKRFRPAEGDESPEGVEELRRFGGVRHIDLSFVGPEHVAASETFETHGPQINYNHNLSVMSLDELFRPHGGDQLWSGLSIDQVLGAGSDRIFAFAAKSALRDSESQEDREMFGDSFLEGASSGWTIARGRGRWMVRGSSGYGSGAARGYYFAYAVPVQIPRSVAGFDEETIPWELVLEEFPDATDAFSSPARDVVVVRTPGRLLICPRSGGGAPGRPVATIPTPPMSSTVMVQWALGAAVSRWTRELTPLLAAGLPEPVQPRP